MYSSSHTGFFLGKLAFEFGVGDEGGRVFFDFGAEAHAVDYELKKFKVNGDGGQASGRFFAVLEGLVNIVVDEGIAGLVVLSDAEVYARVRHELEARGLVIGAMDMLIAAIALSNNLILVTHNTGEFSRISGLKLEDWTSSVTL